MRLVAASVLLLACCIVSADAFGGRKDPMWAFAPSAGSLGHGQRILSSSASSSRLLRPLTSRKCRNPHPSTCTATMHDHRGRCSLVFSPLEPSHSTAYLQQSCVSPRGWFPITALTVKCTSIPGRSNLPAVIQPRARTSGTSFHEGRLSSSVPWSH